MYSLGVMKKTPILFKIFALFLFLGFIQTFSQQRFPLNDRVIILATTPRYSSTSTEKIATRIITTAGKSLDDYAQIGESPPWKKVVTDHCVNCPLADFDFGIISNKIVDKNTVEIKIKIEFENKKSCNAKKTFSLIREKKIEIELKCGVKLVAFYGFNLEKIENNERPPNNN